MKRAKCDRVRSTMYHLDGFMAQYVKGVTEQWLLVAPYANPGMLEMFRDRDITPLRNMEGFAGELAGKYLTSAVLTLRVTGDTRLKILLREFVARLIGYQDTDGYLGPWPKRFRLKNRKSAGSRTVDCARTVRVLNDVTWDAWGHYHVMLGLLLWHDETGDKKALDCVKRIADLLCRMYFGKKKPRLADTPAAYTNLAPAHTLCMLYRKTKNEKYLNMALQIVDEFAAKDKDGHLAGDWFNAALAGKEFHASSGTAAKMSRWEALHAIMALAELHWITGDEPYRRAFEQIWWSLLKTDRHNTGGFSSGERALGNPYDLLSIETCCTIAWIAFSVEMLKLTGDSRVADEMEFSTLNSIVGAHSSTGRWSTYDTPMAGFRKANVYHIAWQGREGTPELNCCSVNASRGFGMLSDWALMKDKEGLLLNYYGPSRMTTKLRPGVSVVIKQETEYPRAGAISIRVTPSKATEFALKLRVPYWSQKTKIKLNGKAISGVTPGQYLAISRRWKRGDRIELTLDMSLHFWRGERDCKGLTSIFRGPMLLAYDRRYNLHLPGGKESVRDYETWWEKQDPNLKVPQLDAKRLRLKPVEWKEWLAPLMLYSVRSTDGKTVHLCDFASAGEVGTPYRTWLPLRNSPKTAAFSHENPLRSARL